jgi:hypothetical protein
MTVRVPGLAAALLALAAAVAGDEPPPPILDVHLHALPIDFQGPPPQTICAPFRRFPAWDARRPYPKLSADLGATDACAVPIVSPATDDELMRRTLEVLERRNVVGVASGPLEIVERWRRAAPARILPALHFGLADGAPSPGEIRALVESGRIVVLGEIVNQYLGVEPDDPRMAPYWALAEELDLPVAVHVGTGPPGAPYRGFPGYRARAHSPLAFEEILLRHPKLRIYLMHAGWPMLDDTLALLWAHPQVHVDTGIIDYALPRAEFHRYLRRLVEAGFEERVMFGSDQMIWPEAIERAIESIESAEFLSQAQKRRILHDNAARFLRLGEPKAP